MYASWYPGTPAMTSRGAGLPVAQELVLELLIDVVDHVPHVCPVIADSVGRLLFSAP